MIAPRNPSRHPSTVRPEQTGLRSSSSFSSLTGKPASSAKPVQSHAAETVQNDAEKNQDATASPKSSKPRQAGGDGASAAVVGRLSPTRRAAQARLEHLMGVKIECVPNQDFRRLGRNEAPSEENFDEESTVGFKKPPKGLPAYLASLYATTLLSREEEADLFRRMNLCKFQAGALRESLDHEHPSREVMDRIEALLAESEKLRNQIIRSNLRLVVSIAKRYVDGGTTFDELVSEGNESLIRAVEKFDFARGYRFSTYATWAVRRHFFRMITDKHKRRNRFIGGEEQKFDEMAVRPDEHELNETEYDVVRNTMARFVDRLGERERRIINLRYGLDRDVRPHTLQQIGRVLGVSKERVRQLEGRAIEKLRKFLAGAESETLLKAAGVA